jgi:hypothetical protein
LIDDREDLLVAGYGQIAIYVKAGTRTFDTCLGMTQGMTELEKRVIDLVDA